MAFETSQDFIDIWAELDAAYVTFPTLASVGGNYQDTTPVDTTGEFANTLAAFGAQYGFVLDSTTTTMGQLALAVNTLFVRLGNEYVAYLESGGDPIFDIAKDRGGPPAPGQSYHDNILGNLDDSPISGRFGSTDPANDVDIDGDGVGDLDPEPRSTLAQEYGERPYFSGNNTNNLAEVIAWDIARAHATPGMDPADFDRGVPTAMDGGVFLVSAANDDGTDDVTSHASIQAAIDAAAAGDTVVVGPGTYDAVTIDKAITILSASDRGATIEGPGVNQGAAIRIEAGVDGVTVGGAGQGFVINASSGDLAAVYAVGSNDGITISGNEIDGGSGNAFLSGASSGTGLTNSTVSDNTLTSTGPTQTVYNNGAASLGATSSGNAFTGNTVSGDNLLMGIEGTGGTISGNTFEGTPGYAALEVFGAGNTITGNSFDDEGPVAFVDGGSNYDEAALQGANTFGPSVRIDGGDAIYNTIQAAIDAAAAGDTIVIGAGTFAESVTVDKALTFQGAGSGSTIVEPTSGSGFDIVGDLGTDAAVSIDGIAFRNAPGAGVDFDDNAILGTLTITNSAFETNDANGVRIGGNYSPVDLDNVVIENSAFTGNGQPSGSSGDGDILFFQYYGDATLRDLSITGQDRDLGPAENGLQFRGDSGALGNVTLENVTIAGVYEKQPFAFFNYDDVNGLSATNVSVTADSASWDISGNFDGIGGDIDFAALGIDTTGAPDPVAVQGDDTANVLTSGAESAILNGEGGDDTLVGGAGDDAFSGGAGTDVAVVADNGGGPFVAGDFDTSGISVTGGVASGTLVGPDGTETLDGIEVIQVANTGSSTFLVLDGMSIQAAVDAASDGDTIVVAAGAFTGDVVVDTTLTILGANAGLAGDDGGRGAESVLDGSFRFVAGSDGSTIDGMRIEEGGEAVGSRFGVYVQADDITVENSVLARTGAFDLYRGVVTATGDGQNLTVDGNLITGFATGVYVNPGSNATVSDNTFDGNFVGLSSDGPDVAAVTGNAFQNSGLEHVGIGGSDDTVDLSSVVTGNTFDASAPEVTVYALGGNAKTFTGTAADDVFNGGPAGDTLNGLGGDDTFDGGAGADVIDGGAGTDTVLAGARSAATIALESDGTFTLNGEDDVSNVETVAFSDSSTIGLPSVVPTQAATEDSEISIDLAALLGVPAGDFTFAVTGDAMGWLSLDPATGVLIGTPDDGDLGGTLSITATETSGLVVTHDFEVTITGINDAPTVSDIPNRTGANAAPEDAAFTFDVTGFFDDPDSALTFTQSGMPGWLSFANGVFSGTPGNGDVGSTVITVTADDGEFQVSAAFTLAVTNVNDAPVANDDTGSVGESGVVTVDVLANDTDVDAGDGKSLDTIVTGPVDGSVSIVAGGIRFDTGGDFEDLAAGEQVTETIVYEMSDDAGAPSQATLTVTINGANDAPTASAIDLGTTDEDAASVVGDLLDPASVEDVDASDTLSVQNVAVTSTDGRTVAFTEDGVAGTVTIDPAQFADLAVGESVTLTVDYEVSDGTVAVANTATLVVEGRNDGPSVSPVDLGTTSETNAPTNFVGQLLDGITDPDGDDLDVANVTVASTNGVRTVTFSVDAETGAITIDRSQFNDLGDGESETLTVDYDVDDGSTQTANTATLVVNGANDAPTVVGTIAPQTADEGQAYAGPDADTLFDDVDANDTLTFSLNGAPAGVSLNPTTNVIEGTPTESGTFNVQVVADDGIATTSRTFQLTVAADNAAPVDNGTGFGDGDLFITFYDSQTATLDYSTVFTDPDGDDLTFSVSSTNDLVTGSANDFTSINSATGVLTIAPDALLADLPDNDIGTFDITVSADDGNGGTVSDTFTLTVSLVQGLPPGSGSDGKGFISGATAFFDANNNGLFDDGVGDTGYDGAGTPESSDTMDSDGDVNVSPTVAETLYATVIPGAAGSNPRYGTVGGVDISTGRAVEGTLFTQGSFISPLTTVLVGETGATSVPYSFVQLQGAFAQLGSTNATLGTGIGELNLFNFDYITAIADTTTPAADFDDAVEIARATSAVRNTARLIAEGLEEVGAGDLDEYTNVAYDALRTVLDDRVGNSTTLDLSTTAGAGEVIDQAESDSGLSLSATQQTNLELIISQIVAGIDGAAADTLLGNSPITVANQTGEIGLDYLNYLTLIQIVTDDEGAEFGATGNGDFQQSVIDTNSTNLQSEVEAQFPFLGSVTGNKGTGGDDTLIGTPDDETIDGLAGNDRIEGLAGNDDLFGNAGDDTLVGNEGADTLNGGDDNDTADYSAETGGAGVTVDLAAGTATDTHGDTDTLTGIENVVGTDAADDITGDSGDNKITLPGTNLDDTVDGGAGTDTVVFSDLAQSAVTFTQTGNLAFEVGTTTTSLTDVEVISFSDVTLTAPTDVTFAGDGSAIDEGTTSLGAVTVTDAADSGGAASHTFSVAVDTAPSGLGGVTFAVDGSGELVVTGGDLDYEAITGSTAFDLSITATDSDGLTFTRQVSFSVADADEAPAGTDISASLTEDEVDTFSQDLADGFTDPEGLAVSLANVPGTLSVTGDMSATLTEGTDYQITGTTLQFLGDPFGELGGGDTATVEIAYDVEDPSANGTATTATFTVDGVNDTVPVQSPDLGSTTETDVVTIYTAGLLDGVSDPDGDDLDTANVTITSTSGRSVSFTAFNTTGTIEFDRSQFNDLAASESETLTIAYDIVDGTETVSGNEATLLVNGENDAPDAGPALNLGTFTEDDGSQAFDLLDGTSDPDGDDLDTANVTVSSDNAGRTVTFTVDDETGALTVDMDQFDDLADGASETITVDYDVTDGTASTADTATFVVNGVNDGPVRVSPIPDQSIDEGALVFDVGTGTLDVTGNFDDVDSTLTYSANVTGGLPSWLSFSNGVFTVLSAPTQDDVFDGTITVQVVASDGTLTATDTFDIAVDNVNDDPVGTDPSTVPPFFLNQGTEDFDVSGFFADEDLDTLTYSDDGTLPAGLSINPNTGVISGTPTAVGTTSVTIEADDGNGGTGTITFDLEVSVRTTGTAGDDTLVGSANDETLLGLEGDDTLTGAAGDDTLDGGADEDTASYLADGGSNGVVANLATGTATDTHGDTDTFVSIENLEGSDQNDQLTGDADENVFYGTAGNDTINGGGGLDVYSARNATNGVFVNLGWGGSVGGSAGMGLVFGGTELGIDFLMSVEGVEGSSGLDLITGSENDDIFLVSAGNDMMEGNGGSDTVTAEWFGQAVTIDLGAGSVSFGSTLQNATEMENAVGSDFADTLRGSDEDNILVGGDGDDTIEGAGGDDTIEGGAGDDDIDGGLGIDTMVLAGDRADYTITLGSVTVVDNDPADGDDGTDTADDVEVLEFADGRVLVVGAGGFDTIQDAIDAAADGDTILVADGTYGGFTVDKGVTIEAANPGSVTIDAGGASNAVVVEGGGDGQSLVLAGLDVTGAADIAVRIDPSSDYDGVTLTDIDISNAGRRGVSFEDGSGGTGTQNVDAFVFDGGSVIGFGTVPGGSGVGINVNDFAGDVTITGATVSTTGGDADYGVNVTGFGGGIGNVSITSSNVGASGDVFGKGALGIQDVDAFAPGQLVLTAVALTGAIDTADPGFVPDFRLLFVDEVGGTIDASGVAITNEGTGADATAILNPATDDDYTGTSGTDVVTTAGGDDDIDTGAGDDVVVTGPTGGTIEIDGGADTDRLELYNVDPSTLAPSTTATTFAGGGTSDGSFDVTMTAGGSPAGSASVSGIEELEITLGNGGDTVDFTDSLTGTDLAGSTVTIVGGTGDDTVEGVAAIGASLDVSGNGGDDTLKGGDEDDTLDGGTGDDELVGRGGSDDIEGGEGIDTATFLGSIGSFTITKVVDGVEVSDGTDTDTVTGVEQLSFDDPVIVSAILDEETLTIGEDGPAAGDALIDAGDFDVDDDTLSVVEIADPADPLNTAAVGETITLVSGATVTLNVDGSYSYDPNGAWEGLDDGETDTDTFEYTVDTGDGLTQTETVTVTIDGANDAPIISGLASDDAGGVTEIVDGGSGEGTATLSDSGTIAFTDADAADTQTAQVTSDQTGFLGTFALGAVMSSTSGSAGTVGWTFDVDDADVEYLAEGETVTQDYTVEVSDGTDTDTIDVTVTITGSNDGPVITTATDGADTEDETGASATGTIAWTDLDLSDRPQVSVALAAGGAVWTGGTLTAGQIAALDQLMVDPEPDAASGSVAWNWSVGDADVDFLAAGETVTLTYEVTVTDDEGATDTTTFDVEVTGTNDAPTVDADGIADVAVSDLDTPIDVSGDFDDVDQTDTLTFTATGLPAIFEMNTDGTITRTGATTIEVGDHTVEVTADDGLLSVSDTFVLSVGLPEAVAGANAGDTVEIAGDYDPSGDGTVTVDSEDLTVDLGTDVSTRTVSLELGAGIEGITLTGGDGDQRFSLTGNDLDNLINAAAAGDDVLDGGDGIDTLDYSGSSLGVTVLTPINNAFSATGPGGIGTDQISGFENFRGTSSNDTFVLGAGNNTVFATAGTDNIQGGAGVDTYDFSDFTAAMLVDLSTNLAIGTPGNQILNGIENVVGGSNNDSITGDAAANELDGRGGNDTLTGGLGADAFVASAGDDRITDFESGVDFIDFSAFDGLTADDVTATLNDDGDLEMSFEGNTLTLEGVNGLAAADTSLGTVFPSTIAEYGEVSANHFWQTVSLDHDFINPVVLAYVQTTNGPAIVETRIRNVDAVNDTFELRVQETSELDDWHLFETVSFLVIEEGTWQLGDGTVLQAGNVDLSLPTLSPDGLSFQEVQLDAGAFDSAPSVFSTVGTYNGPDWVTTRKRAIDSDSFELSLQEEEQLGESRHTTETVGFLAVSDDSMDFSVSNNPGVTHDVSLDLAIDGAFFADMRGTSGVDPAIVRSSYDGTTAEFVIQEDTSFDTEIWHVAETVGVLAFADDQGTLSGFEYIA